MTWLNVYNRLYLAPLDLMEQHIKRPVRIGICGWQRSRLDHTAMYSRLVNGVVTAIGMVVEQALKPPVRTFSVTDDR